MFHIWIQIRRDDASGFFVSIYNRMGFARRPNCNSMIFIMKIYFNSKSVEGWLEYLQKKSVQSSSTSVGLQLYQRKTVLKPPLVMSRTICPEIKRVLAKRVANPKINTLKETNNGFYYKNEQTIIYNEYYNENHFISRSRHR